MIIDILHSADIQVKNREKNLYKPSLNNLKEIEMHVKVTKAPILCLAGDLFEYAIATDSERKLIYNFISRLLNIETLKELILIAGNHDLLKEKKQNETTIGHNALNVYADLMSNLDDEKSAKLIYMDKSKTFYSNVSPLISYHAYSLEDDMKTDHKIFQTLYKFDICVYHAMVKEFADAYKIPLRKDIYNSLDSIEIFPENSLILAGDIHMNLNYKGTGNQDFYYPGSSQQQTHKEGNYIKYTGDCLALNLAEQKVINQYSLDTENATYSVKKLPLKNFVIYNTFELDKVSDIQIYIEQLKTFIENNYDNLNGIDKTFIKIKSVNAFIQNEKDLFDIIKGYFANADISFEYDKFVQIANITNNKVISEIIEEKQKEISENKSEETESNSNIVNEEKTELSEMIITSDNIDNLILSDVQIVKLFTSILEVDLKSVKDDDIKNNDLLNDIKSLFSKQLEFVTELKNSKRYNIVFESIETSGFMGLEKNKIELNIPGIVRILGTNGIGKTTLYNMLRWVCKGKVFPNMSDNQIVKNNLVVFNKKLIDIDVVKVALNATINNQKIVITRLVERKWKNNTTDEQKKSLKWKDFVSTINRDFKIDITTQTGEIKTISGDVAENSIKLWLGDSIDNILFLNQAKIESILRTSSDDLNELVLNFIGVDYIKKLENNLDNVKNELLTIAKPTKSKEDLMNAIIDAKIRIKEITEEQEKVKNDNIAIEKEIESNQLLMKNKNTELLNLGNIPLLIENENTKLTTINEFLNTFEIKEKKEKIVFTEKEPLLNTLIIESHEQDIQICNDLIKKANSNINDKKELNLKIDELLTKEIDLHIQEYVDILSKNDLAIQDKKDSITSKYNEIAQLFDNILVSLNQKLTNEDIKLSQINNEIDSKSKMITFNLNTISTGKCDKCGTILIENFEDHKVHLLDENKKLEEEIINLKLQIPTIDELKIKINNGIKTYTSYKDNALKQNEAFFPDTIKTNQNYSNLFSDIKLFNDELLKIEKVKSENNTEKTSFELLKVNKLYKNDIFNQYELITSYIKSIEQNNTYIESFNNEITTYNNSIKSIEGLISEIKNNHITALTTYQGLLNKIISENNSIDIYNKSVDEHNNSKTLKENEKILVLAQITKLESSLMLYNTLNTEYTALKTIDTELNAKWKTNNDLLVNHATSLANAEKTKENSDKDYTNYLTYQKNNLIWKIYSKLIKNNFKEIVFEYYRTFLNNTLNVLLEDVNFKLFWNNDSDLYHVDYSNGTCSYQPVQQSSGMETCFLGLALVYTIHLLNVKNSVSHIFIDEISGTLNKGMELSYNANNYQELFVRILSKFKNKTLFIIDHNVDNLFETLTYEVRPGVNGSQYIKLE